MVATGRVGRGSAERAAEAALPGDLVDAGVCPVPDRQHAYREDEEEDHVAHALSFDLEVYKLKSGYR